MNLMEVDDGGKWNIVDNTTGMLGHVSQINRKSIYIYGTIKASSGYSPDEIYRDSMSVYLWNVTKHSRYKC